MKIAISATGRDLDAQVDARFGRCPCFIIADPASGDFEVLENKAAATAGGAGIQAAQMVVGTGAEAVITGSLGPNAAEVLATAGMQVYTGQSGTVREVLARYASGGLEAKAASPAGPSAAMPRTGRGAAVGAVPGGGRGMGRGRGRRGGRGGGFCAGPGGECVCPACGQRVPHRPGVPCFEAHCPKCGAVMTRW